MFVTSCNLINGLSGINYKLYALKKNQTQVSQRRHHLRNASHPMDSLISNNIYIFSTSATLASSGTLSAFRRAVLKY